MWQLRKPRIRNGQQSNLAKKPLDGFRQAPAQPAPRYQLSTKPKANLFLNPGKPPASSPDVRQIRITARMRMLLRPLKLILTTNYGPTASPAAPPRQQNAVPLLAILPKMPP